MTNDDEEMSHLRPMTQLLDVWGQASDHWLLAPVISGHPAQFSSKTWVQALYEWLTAAQGERCRWRVARARELLGLILWRPDPSSLCDQYSSDFTQPWLGEGSQIWQVCDETDGWLFVVLRRINVYFNSIRVGIFCFIVWGIKYEVDKIDLNSRKWNKQKTFT